MHILQGYYVGSAEKFLEVSFEHYEIRCPSGPLLVQITFRREKDSILLKTANSPKSSPYNCTSQCVHPPQNPLQMPVRNPRLELRLHMSTQIRLRPHQSPLKMLHSHGPLRPINPRRTVGSKNALILQVWDRDIDRRSRLLLETQLSTPSHILDRQQSTIGDDDHVKVAVAD